MLDDFLAGNPHADRHGNTRVWWFLDTRDGPLAAAGSRCATSHGKPGLHAWRNGDTPSAFVNASKEPVVGLDEAAGAVGVRPPRADGDVAVGWLSPIDGKVRITGRVKDAHPGGPTASAGRSSTSPRTSRDDLVALARVREAADARTRARRAASRPRRAQDVAYAVTEGIPHDAKVHLRGDPEKPGAVVPRRWLEVFGGQPLPANAGSGRLELAGWIASKDNPLTARVMVNRVWLHHFGKGLVKTPNDFGTRGEPPTHPELLDWLAAEFVESGWSVKELHRLIMLSATYRQASATRPDAVGDRRRPTICTGGSTAGG